MTNNRGFTLIEMLVTMVLVIVVIMITGSAFESILKSTGRLTSSEESNIEGVIGLEMFRHDLHQMGYGLPDTFLTPAPTYIEAKFAPANKFNDAPSGVPRPIASWDSLTGFTDTNADSSSSETGTATTTASSFSILDGTDYLAIKATTVGHNKTSKKWTYMTYSALAGAAFSERGPNKWSNTEENFVTGERVIVIKPTFTDSGTTKTLIFNNNNGGNASIYWSDVTTNSISDAFRPGPADSTYFLYGVDDSALGMPFNRADYFVARPLNTSKIPATCAPNVGILYKATVNHKDGRLNYMPLLDCVADMQVVFGWDANNDGVITESSAYSDTAAISVAGTASVADIRTIMLDPIEIKNKLRYVKVYIMAQEGRKDANFTNTDVLVNNTYSVVVGDASSATPSNVNITKGYTAANLAAKQWLNYRWKIYRIVVRPKNLSN
ncbi:MAG: prepilin-type N-terminal cleavage/methylation domain-containing protein [Geobacter sp.]|nr:prepilin-type N-terminal cleavage/methylation domain-containing protein [Geobacter sp.]